MRSLLSGHRSRIGASLGDIKELPSSKKAQTWWSITGSVLPGEPYIKTHWTGVFFPAGCAEMNPANVCFCLSLVIVPPWRKNPHQINTLCSMNKTGCTPSLHRVHPSTVTQPNEMQTWLQAHEVQHRYGLSDQRAAPLGNGANIRKLSLAISPMLYFQIFSFLLQNSIYASFCLQRFPQHRETACFLLSFISKNVAMSFLEYINLVPPSYGLVPHKDSMARQIRRKKGKEGKGERKRGKIIRRRKLILLENLISVMFQ